MDYKPQPPGKLIAERYRIGKLIGSGGTASVYRAREEQSGKLCALKIPNEHMTQSRVQCVHMLEEAFHCQRLIHPNIVRILDAGWMNAQVPFLVMELLDGRDLGHVLKTWPRVSLSYALRIISQIGSALVLAHAQGIIHRDIKPSNIFLHQEGLEGAMIRETAKLTDFGLAKLERSTVRPPTEQLTIAGTPHYMAPEGIRHGISSVDAAADVWALGVLLYRMLSGRFPIERATPEESDAELLHRILMQPIVRIETVAPEVPAHICDAIHDALIKNKAARCPSVAAFLLRLEHRKELTASQWQPPIPVSCVPEPRSEEPTRAMRLDTRLPMHLYEPSGVLAYESFHLEGSVGQPTKEARSAAPAEEAKTPETVGDPSEEARAATSGTPEASVASTKLGGGPLWRCAIGIGMLATLELAGIRPWVGTQLAKQGRSLQGAQQAADSERSSGSEGQSGKTAAASLASSSQVAGSLGPGPQPTTSEDVAAPVSGEKGAKASHAAARGSGIASSSHPACSTEGASVGPPIAMAPAPEEPSSQPPRATMAAPTPALRRATNQSRMPPPLRGSLIRESPVASESQAPSADDELGHRPRIQIMD